MCESPVLTGSIYPDFVTSTCHIRTLYSPMETLLAEQSTADNKTITPSEDLR